jgi:hypothetical protein
MSRSWYRSDKRAIGGFMEAILALMVVTVAIVLLSISFSLAAYDAVQEGSSSQLDAGCEEMRKAFEEDMSSWRDCKLSWSSLGYRQSDPYEVAEGIKGYEIEVVDISSEARDGIAIGSGTMRDANATASVHLACSIITTGGEVHAGLVVITVW